MQNCSFSSLNMQICDVLVSLAALVAEASYSHLDIWLPLRFESSLNKLQGIRDHSYHSDGFQNQKETMPQRTQAQSFALLPTCDILALAHVLSLCLLSYPPFPSFWSRPKTLEIITLARILLMTEEGDKTHFCYTGRQQIRVINLFRCIILWIDKYVFIFAFAVALKGQLKCSLFRVMNKTI